MADDLISMNIMIAGRSYPLRVKGGDQESIKVVVDEINEKIKDFQLTYINKDKQDCLAMALLTYAVDFHKSENEQLSESIAKKVERLEAMIDNVLE
jgi:cell division protein ZapA